MEELRPYKIGFSSLAKGRHAYSFDIGPEFFECFEHSEVAQGLIRLELDLVREENMLVLEFSFSGWVELFCDRCLEAYHEDVEHSATLYVKFGDDHYEQSDDVIVIPSTESHFDIAQYVYEFIHLNLPIKRVHPDDINGKSGCDVEMIKRADSLKPGSGGNDDASADSPFEVLRGLSFHKDN